MGRKRGAYQHRKEWQNKAGSILGILFFLFATVITIYGLIQATVNVRDIDTNTLNTYTGSYEYRLKVSTGRYGSSCYEFTLGNGDAVLASKREVDNPEQLDNNEMLAFRYTTMFSNPLYKLYSAVSITTVDGEVVFVDADESRKESVFEIWLSLLLALLFISVIASIIGIYWYAGDWRKTFLKLRNKICKKSKQSKVQKE